jgi:hypothetical protein
VRVALVPVPEVGGRMKDGWEKVDAVPARNVGHVRSDAIVLSPGQVVRRRINGSQATTYNRNFSRYGMTDYHAAQRLIDGQGWLYIWRDPLPENDA